MISVEVVYATSEQQNLCKVDVLPNATIAEAIAASGLLQQFPEIDLEQQRVGVFGERLDLQHRLTEGDRVEIYRPLQVDPKEARRLRALRAKQQK